MIKKLLFIFILLLSFQNQAQITGEITSTTGEPLSYVNIYIQNSRKGTTSNDTGNYRLNIDKTGNYTVVFQFLGFKTKNVDVAVDEFPFTLNVELEEEITSLDEVMVNSNENPADRIIRKVIESKASILEKRKAYTADFYSRGTYRVKDLPEKILGQEITDIGPGLDSTRSGIIYLSETISKIAYRAPDDFKEKITASKVSGDDNGFSFNSAREANFSFYDNTLEINTQLVSPIANNAFNYYRYKLEGSFYEGSKLINKIKVTPRRANDRVFNGYVYVVEDDWQLYGVELNTTGAAIQVPFIENLLIKHTFQLNEEENLWVKKVQTIDFKFKLFSFQGDGRFSAVYSNYDFSPRFDEKDFSNEVLSFVENANKKDSLYWQKIRPIPLTLEERKDYVLKDSLQIVRKSKKYFDSVDNRHNKVGFLDPIMGYSYTNTYERWRLSYDGPLDQTSFNTIQGFNSSAGISYSSWEEDYKSSFYAFAKANYGLDDDRLRFTSGITKRFNRSNRSTLSLAGGQKVEQFNATEPISPLVNSLATLFWERNYLKAYDLTFARAAYSEEVSNGILLFARAGYEKRQGLFNTTDQTVFPKDEIAYSSNNPLAPADFNTTAIDNHDLGKLDLVANITFDQKYMSYPDGKFNIGESKYPMLSLAVEQGFAASNGDYNFTRFGAGLTQQIDVANKGSFSYSLKGGTFTHGDNISFVDYKHFSGNQTHVNLNSDYLQRFNLLPYYDFSTNKSYFEGHIQHNFKGFILGKIPALRALNFNLIGGAHFLSTVNNKPYSELSVGIDNLGFGKFRFLRVDYVRSFYNGSSDGGFMFGISF
ncbi:DUF5686 and carboxypeptidase regulatory-like domain-containing protein [Leeuwenhoekiella sp. A16]|uniref:DUF5686 and carboxypeptidase regulatory-like domain-containing protein n=1 Tax=unclassified Leeuwenhoekiella TaxID=2615029 RepID=UPI003A8042E7